MLLFFFALELAQKGVWHHYIEDHFLVYWSDQNMQQYDFNSN